MEGSQPPQKPIEEESWRFIKKALLFFSSDWKHSVIFFAALALVIMSTILVIFPGKKQDKKAPQSIVPKSEPTNLNSNQTFTLPSPFPDPTQNWQVVNFAEINLKIPPEATSSTKVKDKLSSLQIIASSSSKPILIIESLDHSDFSYLTNPVREYTNRLYQKNSSSSATPKMITKPIEILIGGVKGYEYYFEGSNFSGFDTAYQVDNVKHRVIQFDENSKAVVIFSNLSPESEQVLQTLSIK